MIRFRNPGTDYITQIQVLKKLYNELGNNESFSLQDMAKVIAQSNLMTAYGYAGDEALKLSDNEDSAKNSALMNAKMYAEVFRMLGWITPATDKSSYPVAFTYIGAHIALTSGDCSKLYEQCVLGINNPTEMSGNMSYDEKIRFFKCALRTFIDLGGIMYKHELCLGPMSVNDENEHEYTEMINYIKSLRGNFSRLNNAFNQLSQNLHMSPTAVDNCTRLPIAFMKACNWVESIRDKTLYGKSLLCLKITQHGIDLYNSIKDMYDLRLDKFESLSLHEKLAVIRLGTYTMLDRAGYDISNLSEQLNNDKLLCKDIINDKELLFSPCQTIRKKLIDEALNIKPMAIVNNKNLILSSHERNHDSKLDLTYNLQLNIPKVIDLEKLNKKSDIKFLKIFSVLKNNGIDTDVITANLFEYYKNSTQNTFYPLISTLFKIMGFNCEYSRTGDNGSRWDAIIIDEKRSIPIEIKSPTEEMHLSIKAIRQALENKIILLSRQTYKTESDVTSLAVGYYLPNERAEVGRLINDFKKTYGIRIGVIDFKTLLTICVSILVKNIGFNKNELYYLEGFLNANTKKEN